MGVDVVNDRVGTLVWVQMKNGSWWPGRVVGPSEASELSPSHDLFSLAKTKTPVKLLGIEDATVEWYDLEKSKRIKAFRCGEFDDFIEQAESSKSCLSEKLVNYERREEAILHALDLEKQQLQKKHRVPGEDRVGTIYRAKRSRCVYLPPESSLCLERTVSHPQHLQDPNTDGGVTKPSGNCKGQTGNLNCEEHELGDVSYFPPQNQTAALQKGKVRKGKGPGIVIDEKRYFRSENGTLDGEDPLTPNAAPKEDSRTGYDTKSGENIVWEVNRLSQIVSQGDYLDKCFDSLCIGHQSRMESVLIDVDLTVQASNQEEYGPLVCLTSRLNGKKIIGHPIDSEVSEDGSSDILLPMEDDTNKKLFDNEGSAILQPVWKTKTAKRTPVSYIACSYPSSMLKHDKTAQACQNSGHLCVKGRGKNFTRAWEFLGKPLKKPRLSSLETRMLSSAIARNRKGKVYTIQPINQGFMGDGSPIPEETVPTRVTCVPVKHICGKLLVEVGGLQS
ncbi:unnamed protein product [Ilex paraguariensis]|uniref:PWWP domain-containing protein n=1 Tax=Ilex paraguariensis TaxID=185542 RepID=A0ABC8S8T7_9AQUA